MTDATDLLTFSIEDEDGNTDEIQLPAGLVDMLREEDDESTAQVVGDISLMAFTSRAHMIAQHGEGETPADVESIEETTLELFEDRFGMTYGEATGHQH